MFDGSQSNSDALPHAAVRIHIKPQWRREKTDKGNFKDKTLYLARSFHSLKAQSAQQLYGLNSLNYGFVVFLFCDSVFLCVSASLRLCARRVSVFFVPL